MARHKQLAELATRPSLPKAESFFYRHAVPVDSASFAFFRISFGFILFLEVCRFFFNRMPSGTATRDWIADKYIAPAFHFTYYGFEWVHPLPGPGMYFVFGLLGFCATCITLGFLYRPAIIAFCLTFLYVFLLEKAEYQNHFYFVLLLGALLAVMPGPGAWSLAGKLHPMQRQEEIPFWCLMILRCQVAIPYVFAGIAKLNYDWLHGQPMQFWLSRMEHLHAVLPASADHVLALLLSWAGMIFDLAIVPLLVWRRTRLLAFVMVVAFHLSNALMFQIGIFPWLMICATTLFFAPDWPRRWLPRPTPRTRQATVALTPAFPTLFVLLLVALAGESLLPFRHVFWPGNVNWTGEGYYFSWRMMLNMPIPALRIVAVDPRTKRSVEINPLESGITPRQLDKMASDPEMLREYAVWLKEQLAQAHYGEMEIHVVAVCSLNGRRPQRLIDPAVDLGRQPRRWGSNPFIVPLAEELNPRQPFYEHPRFWHRDPEIAPLLRFDPQATSSS